MPGNGQCPNAFEDDESNLNSVPPPPPPFETVDIAVTLEVTNETPELFTSIGYQVTVRNLGAETATGVIVDFDYGPQDNPSPLALVNNPNPDYNDWEGIWTIGNLAPGEARTFTLEVFVLAAASPTTTLFAELLELNEPDPNSSNDISEATIFINDGATVNEVIGGTTVQTNSPKLEISNLYPNPTRSELTVAIQSLEEINSTQLEVFDAFGKLIESRTLSLEEGANFVRFDMTDLADGIYLIVLPTGSHQNLVHRFVKMN